MDRFSKIYLSILGGIIAIVIAVNWLGRDTRVEALNARLAMDHVLADYPFNFRVLRLENGVATLSSPRSAEVPAMRFLRTAYPELSRTAVDDPAMMAAQQVLARTQSRAADLILEQPDVRSVRWVVDERWFNERGVFLHY